MSTETNAATPRTSSCETISPSTSAPDIRGDPRDRLWPALVLIAAGLVGYHNTLGAAFIFDDIASIQSNPSIRSLEHIGRVLSPPAELSVSGRPVLNLTFAINYAMSVLNVGSYHALNTMIHIAAGLTLFGLLRRTLRTPRLEGAFGHRATLLAWIVALLWIAHPLQTMCVTYLSQRAESLMGLFYLLTLYGAIRGWQADAAASRRGWHALAVACCALGMGTKEVMATAPLVVMMYDRVLLAGVSHSGAPRGRAAWPLYAGLCATWLLLAALVLQSPRSLSAGFGLADITPWQYLRTQPEVVLHYLSLVFWPRSLCLDYDWPISTDVVWMLVSTLALAVLLVASVLGFIRRRPAGLAATVLFLILAPTSSFIPQLIVASEHRMYLPSAVVITLTVTAVYSMMSRVPASAALSSGIRVSMASTLACAAAISLLALTIRRNEDYRSTASIWADTLEKRPNNPRALTGLGYALAAEGRTEEAISLYRRATSLRPDYPDACVNLAKELTRMGRSDEAVSLLQNLAQRRPWDADPKAELGALLANLGRTGDAAACFGNALELRPHHVPALVGLGVIRLRQGQAAQAVECFRLALKARPDDAKLAVQMGSILSAARHHVEAVEFLTEAVRLNPADLAAHAELAWLMGTSPEPKARNPDEAIRLSEALNAETGGKNLTVLDTLAAAYASAGRFADAVRAAERALALARDTAQDEVARKITQRLELYRKGQPYRSTTR